MRNWFKRSSNAVVLLGTLFSLSLPFQASARPAICSKLERQLVSAGQKAGLGSDKYAQAAREQTQQLKIARGQASRAGCRSTIGSASNNPSCGRILSTIGKMEANLARLQSKAKGRAGRPNRSNILAALNANDCNGRNVDNILAKPIEPTAKKTKPVSFFTILFGGSKESKPIKASYDVASIDKPSKKKIVTVVNGAGQFDTRRLPSSGTFRTLCVRTCDGYYFPVSFSTTSSRFPNDEKACSSMCPGSETKLYYHSVPNQEPEEMISLAQEPYAALPTAFLYRREGVGTQAGCTCQAAPAQPVDTVDSAISEKPAAKWIPYPSFKPNLMEDEETRLNRVGDFTAQTIAELLAAKMGSKTLAAQQNVRVVGPEFLPSQSTATNLQAQGRLNVQ